MAVATSGRPNRRSVALERLAAKWLASAIPQLANAITLLRLASVAPIVMAIIAGQEKLAFWIFLLAGLSDAVDGTVARMTGGCSTFGSAVDPVADKTLLAGALVSLWWVGAVPGWFILLLCFRDSAIVVSTAALYARTRHLKVAPLAIGKISTALQLVLVGMILFDRAFSWPTGPLVDIGIPAVAAVALISLLLYAMVAWRDVPLRRRSV